MIDEETLNMILGVIDRNFPEAPFRAMDLSIALHMKPRKLASALGVLQRQGKVKRFDVRVMLSAGFRATRSFWRKTA